MKLKKVIFIFLFLMLLPVSGSAKELCTIVTGNGKDIGSEIACGTEHFYIIENNSNSIKLLAKYNLYVGANYDKIKLDINSTYIKMVKNANNNWVDTEYYVDGVAVNGSYSWISKIKENYDIDGFISSNDVYWYDFENGAIYIDVYGPEYTLDGNTYKNRTLKFYPYKVIYKNTEGYALQNELALGVTGEKKNAKYPIYATTILFPGADLDGYYADSYDLVVIDDNFEEGYTNFNFLDSHPIKTYLDDYAEKLSDKGYEVSNINLISIKELYNLVYSINGKKLPLATWYDESLDSTAEEEDGTEYYTLGDLKKYLSNDYSWIWNTTYWTRTFVGNIDDGKIAYGPEVYFVSSAGEICYSETDCYNGIPRAGIRPVVTINKSNIKYNISVRSEGNGTIDVLDSALGGDTVSFKLSTKKGSKLSSIVVMTDSNETIEFTEEDISTLENGVYTISLNKFVMPYENVTIMAKWTDSIFNPDTGFSKFILVFIFFILLGTSILVLTKNNRLKIFNR